MPRELRALGCPIFRARAVRARLLTPSGPRCSVRAAHINPPLWLRAPWQATEEFGLVYRGGKQDDITVVVGLLNESAGRPGLPP